MNHFRKILPLEDDPEDVVSALSALTDDGWMNAVAHVDDEPLVLDYLFRRREFSDGAAGNPVLVRLPLLMTKCDRPQVLRAAEFAEGRERPSGPTRAALWKKWPLMLGAGRAGSGVLYNRAPLGIEGSLYQGGSNS